LREHHRIRRLIADPGEGVAVLLAHGLRGHQPVAHRGRELRDDPLDRAAVATEFLPGFDQGHAIAL
jgi:hypothetical protein